MKTFFLVWIIFLSSSLNAQILLVPSTEYPTIQSAIDSSVDGDTVLVATGEYFENINFNGKNIILTSNFILDSDTSFISNTILNGSQNGRVVTISSGEDTTAQLSGFTITNGKSLYGGGIFCKNSNPVLSNLYILNH